LSLDITPKKKRRILAMHTTITSRLHSLQVCTVASCITIIITVCKKKTQQKRRAQQRYKKRAAYPVTIANLDAWHE